MPAQEGSHAMQAAWRPLHWPTVITCFQQAPAGGAGSHWDLRQSTKAVKVSRSSGERGFAQLSMQASRVTGSVQVQRQSRPSLQEPLPTQSPSLQVVPGLQTPHTPPHPLSPHSFPEHWGMQTSWHLPSTQGRLSGQVPQVPPHPLGPHSRTVPSGAMQLGVHSSTHLPPTHDEKGGQTSRRSQPEPFDLHSTTALPTQSRV